MPLPVTERLLLQRTASASAMADSSSNSSKTPAPVQKLFATNRNDEHNKPTQPFTVFIEGNIGSGKTTFLNHFRHRDEVCAQTEPVQKWQNVGGVNLLELMYKEPDSWAMPFQTYVTLTMLQTHTMRTEKPVKLMERSLYSARYCFVENMRTNGVLHKANYQIMQEWYDYIAANMHIQADLIGELMVFCLCAQFGVCVCVWINWIFGCPFECVQFICAQRPKSFSNE